MASKDLTIRLLGDLTDLQKKLNQASNDFSNVGKTMSKTVTPAAAATAVALNKLGNDWRDATDAIIIGTGASGAALDDLLKSAKRVGGQVPNDFSEVGQAIADVNTRLGLTGPELETTTKLFLDLSRVTRTDVSANIASVTRVFGDWSVAVEDQAGAMDTLFAATQQTGIGIDRLSQLVVQFGAPMRQLGFSMEESVAIFGKFEQEGVNIETVMAGLRQGLGRMAKAGEEPIETFQRLIAEIKNAGTQGEANALALEGFGQRAGPDMAAAIREGRFEIDDLVASLGNSGGALDDAASRTLHLDDRLKMLRNQLTGVVGPFGKVGGAVAGVVASTGPLLFGLGQMGPALSSLVGKLGGFANALKLVGGGLGVAGVAFAAYSIHAQRAAHHTEAATQAAQDLSRVAEEDIGRKLSEYYLSAMLAGKSLDEAMADLARTNLEGSKRALEVGEATGLSAEAADALRDAIEAEEAAREQQTRTTEEYAETERDAADAADESTDATNRSADAIRQQDKFVQDVNKTLRDQAKRLEETTARTERFRQRVESLGTEWDRLKGKLSDQQAFINAQRAFERLGEEAQAAIDAGTEATLDQQEALVQLKLEVGNYLVEVGKVPPSVATRIVANIDQAGVDNIQRLIASWTSPHTVPLVPRVVNTGGSTSIRVDENGNVRSVPRGDAGGVVPGPRGKPTLIVAEGGETVVPTHKLPGGPVSPNALGGGSSAPQFNITVHAGMGTDGADVGRLIVEELRKFERFNGPLFGGSSL